MKIISAALSAAACGLLMNCSSPVAMKSGDLATILNSSPLASDRVSVSIQVKSPGEKAVTPPPISGRRGDELSIQKTSEFVYPRKYDLPEVSKGGVIPATPSAFQAIQTGLTMDLKAETQGPLIQVSGKVVMVEVDRFISMGGVMGKPITDDRGTLISENRTEMPAIRSYTTPVYVLVKPGEPVSFEIDHPKKGTRMTLTAKTVK